MSTSEKQFPNTKFSWLVLCGGVERERQFEQETLASFHVAAVNKKFNGKKGKTRESQEMEIRNDFAKRTQKQFL